MRIMPIIELFFGFKRYSMIPGKIPKRMLKFYVNSTQSKISDFMLYFTLMNSKYLQNTFPVKHQRLIRKIKLMISSGKLKFVPYNTYEDMKIVEPA